MKNLFLSACVVAFSTSAFASNCKSFAEGAAVGYVQSSLEWFSQDGLDSFLTAVKTGKAFDERNINGKTFIDVSVVYESSPGQKNNVLKSVQIKKTSAGCVLVGIEELD